MNERPPQNNIEDERSVSKGEIIRIAQELFEGGEVFPFPGLDPESYSKIKAEQEECPGYTTPIDELLERFNKEGFKVVLKDPESGNVLILPQGSDDIYNDFLFPRNLSTEGNIDERLSTLILKAQQYYKSR